MDILVIDDEESLVEQAKIFLESECDEFNVDTALSATEALDIINEREFNAIVSDYKMPEMDGLELLKVVREEREDDIPFIIFTGKGRENVAIKAINLGADRYLRKGGDPRSQYGILADAVKREIEKKEAQRKLRESEKRYRTVFENTGTATIIIEKDSIISMVNKEFEKLSGYPKEEIEGKMSWTDFEIRDKIEGFEKSSEDQINGNNKAPIKYECKFVDRDDETHDIFLVNDVIPNSEKSVVSLLDITKWKEKIEKSQKIGKRYRNMFEKADDGIILLKSDKGEIIDMNPEIQNLSGYSKEKLKGEKIWAIDLFKNKEKIKKFLENDKDESSKNIEEFTLITKDDNEPLVKTIISYYEEDGERKIKLILSL